MLFTTLNMYFCLPQNTALGRANGLFYYHSVFHFSSSPYGRYQRQTTKNEGVHFNELLHIKKCSLPIFHNYVFTFFSSGCLMSVYIYSFIYSPIMFQALLQTMGDAKGIITDKSYCTHGAYILLGGTDI